MSIGSELLTPLDIFIAVGDLEEMAPPHMKEAVNRVLSALAVWVDDLDTIAEEVENRDDLLVKLWDDPDVP